MGVERFSIVFVYTLFLDIVVVLHLLFYIVLLACDKSRRLQPAFWCLKSWCAAHTYNSVIPFSKRLLRTLVSCVQMGGHLKALI